MTHNWKTIREYVDEETLVHEMTIIKCNSIHKTEKQMSN